MLKLLKDHVVLLLVALAMVLGSYVALSLTGELIDGRLLGGALVLVGAIAGLARAGP